MALFRRTPQTPSSDTSATAAKLPKTMPTRFQQGDQRATGNETTYQGSRGGWLKPRK